MSVLRCEVAELSSAELDWLKLVIVKSEFHIHVESDKYQLNCTHTHVF